MSIQYQADMDNHWWAGLRLAILHVTITLLAIGVAFSLPVAARYILYQWWPRVAEDPNLLLATEVGLAAALALLFNVAHFAWQSRGKVRVADLAALVHVRHSTGRFARWRERRLLGRLPASRDGFILTITGFDTFADPDSLLRGQLGTTYEIKVLLLNPYGKGAQKHVDSLPEHVTARSFVEEVEASILYLAALRTVGKKVTLRFYEHEPFWKVAVLGDHVWVQYCHSGCEVKHEPEYVFALNRKSPRVGFFVPFYMHFLDQWDDCRHPEYDFDTGQLVYRDADGNEIRRTAFIRPRETGSGWLTSSPDR